MSFFTHTFFKISFKNLLLFGFMWGCLGFALGCATLLGPVRWMVTYARDNNMADSTENLLVKAIIVLFILVSLITALFLTRRVLETSYKYVRITLPAAAFSGAVLMLSLFLNPKFLNQATASSADISNPEFTFGPYPTAEILTDLKAEGYFAVISLLHPAVTPFEPMLLKDEQEAAQAIGLKVISIPMLPWISQNQEAIAQIKAIASNPKGKYYVHCYLGKDRVNVVKRIIAKNTTATVQAPVATEKASSTRSLEDISQFERGKITKLEKDVYFVPYPTDEEYMGYIIAPGTKQIVSLMAPSDLEAKARIDDEKKLLNTYQVNFKVIPINSPISEKQVKKLLDTLATLPRPLVIHRFFTREEEQQIIDAYLARLKRRN